ncbi:MAG: PVC-type heme-binding CxxCH protein, partial [Planctomycetaceae bacterium]
MRVLLSALVVLSIIAPAVAADDFIPRRQDKPPGPPKSPAEAIAAMTVPEGFSVELVAAEPDVLNPVAMTIDERGRFWICESIEYPRREPGVGRDRVEILEDTDGDGKVDKTTIFAEGLNIPSGIAVGHGGVWVANSPDLLFLQDTDGDGKADKREVVVTGFGRDDTHELPNSLTWGPDGWLYGLNGVFNPSKIEHDGKTHEFTCAVFRIHPVTRKFEVWAEGTSNPWGIAFDSEGSLFVSACVIDHLWHLVETGYYIRQGGPYPPDTWILPSIVKHQHQLAAYCGIHYCDSDAFPPEWRNVLLMGNIHGNCINADVVARNGSTYQGSPRPDFLTANDVWFMTVEQMTGPDGSLYVLDWYDRYHCYQDANADPKGVDRLHGRLYRVRYKNTPYIPAGFDLSKESDDQLIERLDGGNDFLRSTAKRLLAERLIEHGHDKLLSERLSNRNYKSLRDGLWDIVNSGSKQAQRNAVWTLISGDAIEDFMLLKLFESDDATLRAWGVRAAGNYAIAFRERRAGVVDGPQGIGERVRLRECWEQLSALTSDSSPDVRLQVAIATSKGTGLAPGSDPIELLVSVLKNAGDDPLIPAIAWQNLKPMLDGGGDRYLTPLRRERLLILVEQLGPDRPTAVDAVLSRYAGMLLAAEELDAEAVATVAKLLATSEDAGAARDVLRAVFDRIVSGGLPKKSRDDLLDRFDETLEGARKAASHPLHRDAILLATLSLNNDARHSTEALLKDVDAPGEDRLAAAEALIAVESIAAEGLPPGHPASALITRLAGDSASGPVEFRGGLLAVLGRSG